MPLSRRPSGSYRWWVGSRRGRAPASWRPTVEILEDRIQPSSTAAPSPRPPILVGPTGSLQAAVNGAAPGSTIFLAPGAYTQPVVINTPSLTLVGLTDASGNRAVFTNPGGVANGIIVLPGASNFTLTNVGVTGFGSNGVFLLGVRGFHLAQVTAANDGEYGLFPVLSSGGMIEGCSATGHRDTGIYVGQSHDVTIRSCSAFGNVIGFEIENSKNVQAVGNVAFDNTAGIFVDLLPGLAVTTSSANTVAGNLVFANNRANFGVPGDIETSVPSGAGILILGGSGLTVTGNTALGNNFTGVGLGSVNLLTLLAGVPPASLAGLSPNPTGTEIHGNIALQNGTKASPPLPGADLVWDGSGANNCWSGNTFGTSVPPLLPQCHS